MREIKFRAWNKEENIMCYENEDFDADYWDGHYASILEVINNSLKADRYIFMQYTGLKDKNGKEIYEGEVLQDSDCVYEVIFEYGCFDVKVIKVLKNVGTQKGMTYQLSFIISDNDNIKVMGNIYENPELLEDK